MPTLAARPGDARRPTAAEPLRRKRIQPPPFAVVRRRTIHALLVFATIVLVVDALFGDKGLVETLKARKQYQEVAASLDALRLENSRLREQVRRLNDDPAAIEAVARKDLGLIRPGELLVVIKDVKPAR
jgi:cell division protein FtsB